MSSPLLESIGLGQLDIAYIFIFIIILLIILIGIIVYLTSKLNKLTKKYNRFMGGKNVKALEKEIVRILNENKQLKDIAQSNKKDIDVIYKILEFSYQKCGIVKYDAFRQMGGKLSFSLALLNKRNDGFILNSVHSSDGCYSYTKEIRGGKCDIDLGDEEQHALDLAMGEY